VCHSHVLDGDVLEDLTVVHIPDRLVVPHLGRQQDGTQHNALPVAGTDVHLSIGEESLQVHLCRGTQCEQVLFECS